MALPVGLAPTLFPQTTGCFSIQLREPLKCGIRIAECGAKSPAQPYSTFRIPHSALRMVGSAGNAPVRRFRHIFCDARFTVGQPDHFPFEFTICDLRFTTCRQLRVDTLPPE